MANEKGSKRRLPFRDLLTDVQRQMLADLEAQMAVNAPRTMADWWDALGQTDREEVLRKCTLKTWPATRTWKNLGWFVQGVLNDQWWRNHVGDARPAYEDGPVDQEEK